MNTDERIAANAALLRLFKNEYRESSDRHSDALLVREYVDALLADKARLAKAANDVLCSYLLHLRVRENHPCPENLVIARELRIEIDAALQPARSAPADAKE